MPVEVTYPPLDIGRYMLSSTSGAVLYADANKRLAQDVTNLYWDATNKRLGIGTNTPSFCNHINNSTLDNLPTLGNPAGKWGWTVSNTYGLFGGVTGPGWSWLQSARVDGTAAAYDIVLQPLGGNVSIGKSSPGNSKLNVTGLPIAAAGLSPGDIWCDTTGGLNILKVV